MSQVSELLWMVNLYSTHDYLGTEKSQKVYPIDEIANQVICLMTALMTPDLFSFPTHSH